MTLNFFERLSSLTLWFWSVVDRTPESPIIFTLFMEPNIEDVIPTRVWTAAIQSLCLGPMSLVTWPAHAVETTLVSINTEH
ncbi:MAG: hypothetical protein CL912_20880 [Deltaproteobacteria bacterium]|nr:hypothetical protein [Deltaproteobacteria bacterium]